MTQPPKPPKLPKPPKPFKSYSDLTTLLIQRNMDVEDPNRAERKLTQVGYYRLSGFWYPCRKLRLDKNGQPVISPLNNKPERLDDFEDGTSFNAVFELYLFDKKLRQLMLDAIERIEVHVRSVIANEIGYDDPLAYQYPKFINPKQTYNFKDKTTGKLRNTWNEWLARQNEKVNQSKEDCINWHRQNNKAMPFWVVVEAWDFGTMSKYFEILKWSYQNKICKKIGISDPIVLKNWLQEINTLRNRCAHHSRIWNQCSNNPLPVPKNELYFANLKLDNNATTKIYGLISVIWFLIEKIGPNSDWIAKIADLIDSKPKLPGCLYKSMGFPNENGFPRSEFNLLVKKS